MNTRQAIRGFWPPLAVRIFVSVICLTLLVVSISSAQTTATGSIEGNAMDPNGAGVSGAKVTVTGPGGRSVSVTANEDGNFRFPQLDPGRYTITIEGAQGFARFEQTNIEVTASKTTKLTLNLRVAGVTETVNTPSSSPSVELTPTQVGGAIEFSFDTTKFGTIKTYLPNDIRPGDTVSGSYLLQKFPFEKTEPVKVTSPNFEIKASGTDYTFRIPTELPPMNRSYLHLALLAPDIPATTPKTATLIIPISPYPSVSPTDFVIPPLTQQGRAAEIKGAFDGDLANTTARVDPSTAGQVAPIKVLAESPRKIVFVAPVDVTGPYSINGTEGDKTFTGNSRNIGVRLTAPKTNLTRGEKTVVTIQVSGLSGIIKEVPLQLDSKGVITMEGGSFQNLRIKPEEVKLDGTYTTTRGITGVQAGGFSVTATVIVGPFDISLQDDTDPNRLFNFNSFTGDYVFACGGGSCRNGGSTGGTQTGGSKPGDTTQPGGTVQPGGTPQPGGTGTPPIQPSGVTLTGIGRPAMKGCIITLSHNAPDRRVFARLDACTKTGDASVETKSPKANFNITDKNTTDNTAPSPPPK